MIKTLTLYIGGVIVFLLGMIAYGIFLDLRKSSLDELLIERKITKIEKPKLVINRIDYKLHFYVDTILIKTYNIALGGNPKYSKQSREDRYTPVGDYFICSKKITTGLGKVLILNYPSLEDAVRGLRDGLISEKEFQLIQESYYKKECPPMDTKLGGYVKIHGNGKFDFILRNLPFVFNWTDGSIAVNNSEIEELYESCPIGTPVYIY
ncbi:MAG: L,D-transpeptidase [Ignavibacteria bacterium]|nr:L,D-transpeptidase [Ignavibacteria bacterium]